jgi:hypothetical protein
LRGKNLGRLGKSGERKIKIAITAYSDTEYMNQVAVFQLFKFTRKWRNLTDDDASTSEPIDSELLSPFDFIQSMSIPCSFDELKQRSGPPLNAWGLYGADDELGRLNLITPESIKRGRDSIHHGIRINLK